jgi:hypothetical protein
MRALTSRAAGTNGGGIFNYGGTLNGAVDGGNGHQQSTVPRLSRAQFVRAADRICTRDHQAEKAIPNPTNMKTLLSGLRRAIPVVEREIAALRALEPPRQDTALFGRVLDRPRRTGCRRARLG